MKIKELAKCRELFAKMSPSNAKDKVTIYKSLKKMNDELHPYAKAEDDMRESGNEEDLKSIYNEKTNVDVCNVKQSWLHDEITYGEIAFLDELGLLEL